MRSPLARAAAILAAALTCVALLIHGWHALRTGCYVDLVTGVWLALADDLVHGVFYRPLIGPDGYGGTRYFPLFFTSVAALMRLGIGALVSGFAISLASGAVLVLGLRRMLLDLRLSPALAVGGACFALAPQFAQQALFAIRSDILAAGLVVWGLASARPAIDGPRPTHRPLDIAAVFFVMAAATKITSLYAPAAVVVALLLGGRRRAAIRVSVTVGFGTAVMIGMVAAASGGRAIESWRTCALAAAGIWLWLAGTTSALFAQIIGPSHMFTAVLLAAAIAWFVLLRANGSTLMIVLLPATLGATALVLASPGTIYTNQLIDAFAVCIVVIACVLGAHSRWQPPAALALLVLSVAAAHQSLKPVLDEQRRQHDWQRSVERAEVVRGLASSRGLVFSESPELPVTAGIRPYLIDPFALRVVTLRRADVLQDVTRSLDEQRFSTVILNYDPESAIGRGWYTNLDLGWPIVSRIVANYELAGRQGGLRVYRPKPRAPASSGPAWP